ncbi:uncharacterized protein GJ701_001210 [Geothlypis trichas]
MIQILAIPLTLLGYEAPPCTSDNSALWENTDTKHTSFRNEVGSVTFDTTTRGRSCNHTHPGKRAPMLLRDEYLHHGKFSGFPQIEVMPSGRWQLAVTHISKNQKSCSRNHRKELGPAQHQSRWISAITDKS